MSGCLFIDKMFVILKKWTSRICSSVISYKLQCPAVWENRSRHLKMLNKYSDYLNAVTTQTEVHYLIFTSPNPVVIKTFAVSNKSFLTCWVLKQPSSWGTPAWRERDLRRRRRRRRRRGMQPTQGNTLGRGRGRHTSPLISKILDPKCSCPHSMSPFFSWWLNAMYMRSTATNRKGKKEALWPQITHYDRHMFLIPPWEDNHCFSLIPWKQRRNVQKLTHTSSKRFNPRTGILHFFFYYSQHPKK